MLPGKSKEPIRLDEKEIPRTGNITLWSEPMLLELRLQVTQEPLKCNFMEKQWQESDQGKNSKLDGGK